MKHARTARLALSHAATASGAAFASGLVPKSPDQVRADWVQAHQDGTLTAHSKSAPFRERGPSRHPIPHDPDEAMLRLAPWPNDASTN